jgi:hypothetical protein
MLHCFNVGAGGRREVDAQHVFVYVLGSYEVASLASRIQTAAARRYLLVIAMQSPDRSEPEVAIGSPRHRLRRRAMSELPAHKRSVQRSVG